MLLVYRVICLAMALLVSATILRSRTLGEKIAGAMVLVPLVLRVALVK